MDKQILKQVMLDSQKDVQRFEIVKRRFDVEQQGCYVLVGLRRAGKSFLLFQRMQELLSEGKTWADILYLNFEDERLAEFQTDDFNLILQAHEEMYARRPILFLDEIQNIPSWEKFARRLADNKYIVYITGSNAKMLSNDVLTSLGGRYFVREVYPYSWNEMLFVNNLSVDETAMMLTSSRAQVFRLFDEYLHNGGLPEATGIKVKRNYLLSVYQKVYLGDIIVRNAIRNQLAIRLLLRKLAESVRQPVSYSRLANILSTMGTKISVPTVASYISFAEDAWLIIRVFNIAAAITERESVCKYYFIDNGILNLSLVDADAALFENLVAINLVRLYGKDRVFFYRHNVEIDFYMPDLEVAIQACYSINDEETFQREVGALTKFKKRYSCEKRYIITYDDERQIEDEYGIINVLPAWKWLAASDGL